VIHVGSAGFQHVQNISVGSARLGPDLAGSAVNGLQSLTILPCLVSSDVILPCLVRSRVILPCLIISDQLVHNRVGIDRTGLHPSGHPLGSVYISGRLMPCEAGLTGRSHVTLSYDYSFSVG
jgi:hypothetical protein